MLINSFFLYHFLFRSSHNKLKTRNRNVRHAAVNVYVCREQELNAQLELENGLEMTKKVTKDEHFMHKEPSSGPPTPPSRMMAVEWLVEPWY